MNENESKIEAALELIVWHCYAMVYDTAKDSISDSCGAVVDLSSGGCLFVPGIWDSRVATRVKQFMSLSQDCIAAWTPRVFDSSADRVVIHLQWQDKHADITLPRMTQYLETPLPLVHWDVFPRHDILKEVVGRSPIAVPMPIRNAEEIVRNHLNTESHVTKSTIGHGERSHGCFIDRENRDMFIDECLFGSFLASGDSIAVRQRLETFSYGRRAVTFGIAKFANGAQCETQIWRKKMSVRDSVLEWCHRNRLLQVT